MPDVTLTVTVPDAWITKTLGAFNTIADTHMTIEARGHAPDPQDEFNGRFDFRIIRDLGDNDKQWAERVLRELGKAVVKMVDLAEDNVRYREEISSVLPPTENVDDGVLV